MRGCLLGPLAGAALLMPVLALAQSEEGDTRVDTTALPRPAEMASRAQHTLLLDVAYTGSRWLAVGQHGDLLSSEDGIRWTQLPCPVDATLDRLRFLDQQHGWIVGYDGTLLSTDDGGKSWKLELFDAAWGRPYFDVLFTDAGHGWLAGANGVLKRSVDGGKTWEVVNTEALQDQSNVYNVLSLGDGSLLLAGERGLLARSTDEGASWKQLKSPYTGSYFGALAIGRKGVLVFGLRGNSFFAADASAVPELSAQEAKALRSAAFDAEAAARASDPVSAVPGWTRLSSDNHESLFGGALTSSGRLLLVGANGRIAEADLANGALRPLAVPGANSNMNAATVQGDALVVVGTGGVQRLVAPH